MARRKKKTSEEAYRDALLVIAPGTIIREAISTILQAGTGALLCFGSPKRLFDLSEGSTCSQPSSHPSIANVVLLCVLFLITIIINVVTIVAILI